MHTTFVAVSGSDRRTRLKIATTHPAKSQAPHGKGSLVPLKPDFRSVTHPADVLPPSSLSFRHASRLQTWESKISCLKTSTMMRLLTVIIASLTTIAHAFGNVHADWPYGHNNHLSNRANNDPVVAVPQARPSGVTTPVEEQVLKPAFCGAKNATGKFSVSWASTDV